VMGCCECMIKIGVYQLICNKTTVDERIWEVIDWHHKSSRFNAMLMSSSSDAISSTVVLAVSPKVLNLK